MMETLPWLTFFGSSILQLAGLIIVLWQFSVKSNRKIAERDATWQTRLEGHDRQFKATEKAMDEIKTHIAQLEQQFNHRFTDYKNQVVEAIHELKEDKDRSLDKLSGQLSVLNGKISKISLDLAFLKGERYKEGKAKFPSQNNHSDDAEG